MVKDKTKLNILVVEDNEGDIILISEYLEEYFESPHITIARSFADALARLAHDNAGRFDVVLLDLSLPDKSGADLITDMSKVCPDCPLIVLSGFADLEFSIKSLAMGVSDYLVKDDITAQMLYKSLLYNLERSRTNRRLKASEAKFSNLFNLSPQPMWLYDPVTFEFLQVNQAAITHYGYSELEFMSMTIMDIRPPQEKAKVQKAIADKIFLPNQAILTGRFRHFKKSGEQIDVEIYSSEIIVEEKIYRSVIAIDVTEKILFENKMTKAIIKTQEDERYEIGGELHDNVCQILATSQLTLGMLKQDLAPRGLEFYELCKNYIILASNEIRNLSHRLAPAFFADSNLEDSFKILLKDFNIADQYEIALFFHEDVKKQELTQEMQLNLYRILQEQLRNIFKHAKATSIEIDVLIHHDSLKMWISDNGVGFDPATVKEGIGLNNIRRRAELFSGRFEVETSPGNGCEIAIYLPLHA
jgi:PAS domain S-box-containing protein